MKRLVERNQRKIATAAFLLASFLEICGCNPVRTCEQLRLTRMSAMPWETLVQQCAQCLSSHEMAALRQVADGSIEMNIAAAIMANQTVAEALLELRGPSFDLVDDASVHGGSGLGISYAPSRNGMPSQSAQPIAWPIPMSVLFLYDRAPGSDGSARRIGTGFVLAVANPWHRENDRYLVTARHVVDPEWAGCGEKDRTSITVRFNRWAGGFGYETIALDDPRNSPMVLPADDLTDLAMVPLDGRIAARLDTYRVTETGFDKLPTSLELSSLHHDQSIVTAGISWPNMSGLSELPVSDSGVLITTSSNAPVKVMCSAESSAKRVQLWLIDASVPAGVSGAPVYAEMARGPRREVQPVLVGIQAAVWPGKGMAGMTPVTALSDLVQSTLNRDEIAMDIRSNVPH